jgi:hypothetical protein
MIIDFLEVPIFYIYPALEHYEQPKYKVILNTQEITKFVSDFLNNQLKFYAQNENIEETFSMY